MSSIIHKLDTAPRHSQRYAGGIDIPSPLGRRLVLAFPRWSPGSYLIREYGRFAHDFRSWAIVDGESVDCSSKRHGSNEVHITIPDGASSIHANWLAFGHDLTVRTNHIDPSHFHMVPSATFPRVIRGSSAPEGPYTVQIDHPEDWTVSTQLISERSETCSTGLRSIFSAASRDALYDGVMEANATPEISFQAGGRRFLLKLWDAGGLPLADSRVNHLVNSMQDLFAEFHALFGEPPWDNYVVILHLTEKARGGLEHTGSQASQMPRTSMDEGDKEGWRDLISLLSHEYVHAWNVKRLRPKSFEDYDLSIEMHTDLLWWFEGGTSWLGDMLCVRSGAWTEEDWRKDFLRKMKRHTGRNGMAFESLTESSHDAWIHLYRGHAFSRETQISYYLEGELTMMELDMELRKRSKGANGVCDLMALLCERHALDCEPTMRLGVTHADIRKALTSMKGGGRLGAMLDRMVNRKQAPDMERTMAYFGLKLEPEHPIKEGEVQPAWLGLNLSIKAGKVTVSTHLAASPLRMTLMPGDEIIAIEGRRTSNMKSVDSALRGKIGREVKLTYAHEGMLRTCSITLPAAPRHNVKL